MQQVKQDEQHQSLLVSLTILMLHVIIISLLSHIAYVWSLKARTSDLWLCGESCDLTMVKSKTSFVFGESMFEVQTLWLRLWFFCQYRIFFPC